MERVFAGRAASPGRALGTARVLAPATAVTRAAVPRTDRKAEAEEARHALERAAAEVEGIAARLRAAGRRKEAEIVDAGAMMARDPGLERDVVAAIFDAGVPAAAAILDAAGAQADVIAALDDPMLAERADDVRSVGRRAAALIGADSRSAEEAQGSAPGQVLVATDLGPAEVAELEAGVDAIALAAGGVSAHAAIVARSLGIPMVVCAGEALLELEPGTEVVVDGGGGVVVAAPDTTLVESVEHEQQRLATARARALADRDLPAVTTDGHHVVVRANVAGPAELAPALEGGADGVGLLRTELAFLDANEWPTEADHVRALAPILAELKGMTATVRVLDFGGDKTPPFLRGTEARGIGLMLEHPGELATQLRAIVIAAAGTSLRIMLPMVDSVEQLKAARAVLDSVTNGSPPPVGAMVETADAVRVVDEIAAESDFIGIGTNDLTHSILDADRFSAGEAPAHHPAVLRAIHAAVLAAEVAAVPVEVCGEAASDPVTAPVLVGTGVGELSVGAARVGIVRHWIRAMNYGEARVLAAQARLAGDAAQVHGLAAATADRLSLPEGGNPAGEILERPVGVGANGAQPQARSAPRA